MLHALARVHCVRPAAAPHGPAATESRHPALRCMRTRLLNSILAPGRALIPLSNARSPAAKVQPEGRRRSRVRGRRSARPAPKLAGRTYKRSRPGARYSDPPRGAPGSTPHWATPHGPALARWAIRPTTRPSGRACSTSSRALKPFGSALSRSAATVHSSFASSRANTLSSSPTSTPWRIALTGWPARWRSRCSGCPRPKSPRRCL